MSLSPQESILLALNQRSKEVATMFAIAKEQQEVSDSILKRVLVETSRLETQMKDFDKLATTKLTEALRHGLKDIGAQIVSGAHKQCLSISDSSAEKVKDQIDNLKNVSAEVQDYLNVLSIRLVVTVVVCISAVSLVFLLFSSMYIKYQRNQIISNDIAINTQRGELSLLKERGIKIQNFENGTWLIAPEGLTLGRCGKAQCVQLR